MIVAAVSCVVMTTSSFFEMMTIPAYYIDQHIQLYFCSAILLQQVENVTSRTHYLDSKPIPVKTLCAVTPSQFLLKLCVL